MLGAVAAVGKSLLLTERARMVEEIRALKELLDMGAITQEEYDKKKAELLNADISAPAQASSERESSSSRQSSSAAVSGEKSKIAAGLLAIFLGTLGVHKFYLGYTKEGLIMLLITILGSILFGLGAIVMAVIAFIEGIIYLTKTDEQFEAIYVQGEKGWF